MAPSISKRENMPHFTLEIDGKETDVEVSDESIVKAGFKSNATIADEYVPKANVEAAVQAAKKAAKKAERTDLRSNEEFVTEILTAAGVPLDDDGKPVLGEGGMSPEDFKRQLGEHKTQWLSEVEAKRLQPLEAKNKNLTEENLVLRDEKFVNTVMTVAKKYGVKDHLFTILPGAPLTAMPIVAQIRGRFAWNEEISDHALVSGTDAEGNLNFEISSKEGRQFAGVDELFDKFKADPETRKAIFNDERATSSNLGKANKNGQSGGRIMLRSEFDKLNPSAQHTFVVKDGGKVEDA